MFARRPGDRVARLRLTAGACLLLFVVVTVVTALGGLRPLDSSGAAFFETHASLGGDVVMGLAAALVGTYATAAWVGALLLVCAARRRIDPRIAALLAGLVVASVIEVVLKSTLHHPGPPYSRDLLRAASGPTITTQGSFPSGQMARALILLGGVPLLLDVGRRRAALVTVVAGAAVAVAVSRLYLGDHWASDTIAGLLLGGACLAAAASVPPASAQPSGARAPAPSRRTGAPPASRDSTARAGEMTPEPARRRG